MTIRRALVVGPLNYSAQIQRNPPVRGVYVIPGATNGVRQVYDVVYDDAVSLVPDASIEVLGSRAEAIQAYSFLRRWLINVLVTTGDPQEPTRLCQPGAMKAGETMQVLDAAQVQRTRTKAQLTAGDRPLAGEWWPAHEWAGRPNDLGDDE